MTIKEIKELLECDYDEIAKAFDLKAYFLEEIVIFAEYQNKGYGVELMEELERAVRQNGVEHIELISVNDEHHMHFYKKLGFYAAGNLALMGKHF